MKPKRHLFFSPEKCTGCRLCELACSQINTGEYNPDRATIHVLSHPDLGSHLLAIHRISCICKDGSESCEEICTVGAIQFADDETVPHLLKKGGWMAAPVLD